MTMNDLIFNRNTIIGEGASSGVYEGTHGGIQVAVKAFKAKGKLSEAVLAAIEQEEAMSKRLKHTNIVAFCGRAIDPNTGWPVLVFERLGISIYEAICGEPIPSKDVRNKWLLDTANAIKYLHEQNPPIIHRDIKPDNILIHLHDQRAVLADFGLTTVTSTHTTYSMGKGPIVGHACYTPPEAMLPGYKPSTSYDVFSFAMTMYFITSRHWPFEGESMIGNQFVVSRWIQDKSRPRRSGTKNYGLKIDSISDKTWNLIERCWAQEPQERPMFSDIFPELEGFGYGLTQDYGKIVIWYNQAKKNKNVTFQLNLGVYYEKGQGVEQDYAKAVMWYQKAADQGHKVAQCYLGFSYERGQGVEQDYAKAVMWYQKAADQEDEVAQCNLGFCYERGQGVEQDYAKAVMWYQKAADQGYARAQCNLGVCYNKGQGVDQDYAKAVMWYQKAAVQGHKVAQCNLGLCYERGQGVEQDYAKAVMWYQKAADQGYARAQCNLGVCYKRGQGVEQDYAKAVMWYQKAADQGYARAQCNLGVCYEREQGVEQKL